MRAKTVACDFCGMIDPESNFVIGMLSGRWTEETRFRDVLKGPVCEVFEVCETCFDQLAIEISRRRVIVGIETKPIAEFKT